MIPEHNPEHAEALNLDKAVAQLARQHQLSPVRMERYYMPQDNGDLFVRTVLVTVTCRQLVVDALLQMGKKPDSGF